MAGCCRCTANEKDTRGNGGGVGSGSRQRIAASSPLSAGLSSTTARACVLDHSVHLPAHTPAIAPSTTFIASVEILPGSDAGSGTIDGTAAAAAAAAVVVEAAPLTPLEAAALATTARQEEIARSTLTKGSAATAAATTTAATAAAAAAAAAAASTKPSKVVSQEEKVVCPALGAFLAVVPAAHWTVSNRHRSRWTIRL